jgi:hypothetical protein
MHGATVRCNTRSSPRFFGQNDGAVSNRVEDFLEIENFLPPSYAQILEDMICKSGEFMWQYNASTNDQSAPQIMNKTGKAYEADQFVHALFQEGARRSPFFDIVFPMFYFMEEKTGVTLAAVERIKANLLVQKPSLDPDAYNTPHIDIPDPGFKSLLYYVKDGDGDTFIFNETIEQKKPLTLRKRVTPKKGKALLFNSNIWHASSHPRENATRVVLNSVFSFK